MTRPHASALLNADLHCHSVVSDGTLTPEQLAPRATEMPLQMKRVGIRGSQHNAVTCTGTPGLIFRTDLNAPQVGELRAV